MKRCVVCFILLLSCRSSIQGQVTPELARRSVENELVPHTIVTNRTLDPLDLASLMAQYRVPAVSIAVIDGGRIAWTAAYGLADSASMRPATIATLFQAASISKPVTALAVMRLAEAGALYLDRNINTFLHTWNLPENEFTLGHPVTLRHLLSHTGGITVHGFPGYERGSDLPELVDILDGMGSANTAAIRVSTVPGAGWRYSGGGYTLVQQVLIDVSGLSFPEIVRDLVLEPAGMTESTFAQPLPPDRHQQVAAAYLATGEPVSNGWHVYPEMAAAGLWTTPTDLARFVIEVQRSLNGEPGAMLGQTAASEMMVNRNVVGWGLGFQIRGEDGTLSFEHGGSNRGYRAAIFALAYSGQGAVVMTNSDAGRVIHRTVLRTLAQLYDWPTRAFPIREMEAVDVKQETMDRLVGTYSFDEGRRTISVFRVRNRLIVDYNREWTSELFPASRSRWYAPADGTRFSFQMTPLGAFISVDGRIHAKRVR